MVEGGVKRKSLSVYILMSLLDPIYIFLLHSIQFRPANTMNVGYTSISSQTGFLSHRRKVVRDI